MGFGGLVADPMRAQQHLQPGLERQDADLTRVLADLARHTAVRRLMGAGLSARAQVLALPRLRTDKARVVLLIMCHHAVDKHSNPVYFAGSAVLANALGYPAGSAAGDRAVARAIAELVDRGLVAQLEGTRRTHKRRWLITLPDLGAT